MMAIPHMLEEVIATPETIRSAMKSAEKTRVLGFFITKFSRHRLRTSSLENDAPQSQAYGWCCCSLAWRRRSALEDKLNLHSMQSNSVDVRQRPWPETWGRFS